MKKIWEITPSVYITVTLSGLENMLRNLLNTMLDRSYIEVKIYKDGKQLKKDEIDEAFGDHEVMIEITPWGEVLYEYDGELKEGYEKDEYGKIKYKGDTDKREDEGE